MTKVTREENGKFTVVQFDGSGQWIWQVGNLDLADLPRYLKRVDNVDTVDLEFIYAQFAQGNTTTVTIPQQRPQTEGMH